MLMERMTRTAPFSVRSQLVWLERHLPRSVPTGLSAKERLPGQQWKTIDQQVCYMHRLEQRIAPQPRSNPRALEAHNKTGPEDSSSIRSSHQTDIQQSPHQRKHMPGLGQSDCKGCRLSVFCRHCCSQRPLQYFRPQQWGSSQFRWAPVSLNRG